MSDEYLSSDFSYKNYSLRQLDEWVNDAMNCEDLTPQDIYDTVIKCVDDNIEYHKKYLTKGIELLSLLKGQRPVDFGENVTDASAHDFDDFWYGKQYTEEEMNAMCDAAADKEKCREYNLREAEYYTKRAELDAQHSEHWSNPGRNKTYDQMVAEGWTMTADGFWIKENDKGTMSVSN